MGCCKDKCSSLDGPDPIDCAAIFVAKNSPIDEKHGLDPYTIMIIINIIVQIIKLLSYYYKDKNSAVKAMKTSWIKKMIVWNIVCKFAVNKETKKLDRELALDIYEGVCKMIDAFTDEEKARLFISNYLK